MKVHKGPSDVKKLFSFFRLMTGITAGHNNRWYNFSERRKSHLYSMFRFVNWWCISHAWSTPSFCVKGWEVYPQMKPFNCLHHTKNLRLISWEEAGYCGYKRSSSCEFAGSQLVTQQLCSAQLLYRLRSGAIMQRGQNLLCESKMSPQCTLTVALLQTSTGWNMAARPRSVAGLRDKLTACRRKLQLWDRKTQENGYFFLDINL